MEKMRLLTVFMVLLAGVFMTSCEKEPLPVPVDLDLEKASTCNVRADNRQADFEADLRKLSGDEPLPVRFEVVMLDPNIPGESFEIKDWYIQGEQHAWSLAHNEYQAIEANEMLVITVNWEDNLLSNIEFTIIVRMLGPDGNTISAQRYSCESNPGFTSPQCDVELLGTTGNQSTSASQIMDTYNVNLTGSCGGVRFEVTSQPSVVTDFLVQSIATGTEWSSGEVRDILGTDRIKVTAFGDFDPSTNYTLVVRIFDDSNTELTEFTRSGYTYSSPPANCQIERIYQQSLILPSSKEFLATINVEFDRCQGNLTKGEFQLFTDRPSGTTPQVDSMAVNGQWSGTGTPTPTMSLNSGLSSSILVDGAGDVVFKVYVRTETPFRSGDLVTLYIKEQGGSVFRSLQMEVP